jgi:hypothetical protein
MFKCETGLLDELLLLLLLPWYLRVCHLQVFAPFMYRTVLKVLHNNFSDPQDALPQRMAAHHELYDMMRRRCEDFLAGQPDLGSQHGQI